ncbi:tyrosine-type recombinase/integrase [Streptomyces sp. NPDC051217]|uniref:tyrosine-type recombinase/integrase n=1 Tax=Streptomyces sp. NPDC051217 TaxID=3365644 RepID=UPI0037A1C512
MRGEQRLLDWASIEILRRTGARIEELLELTHLSLRQYQAPTGETVPLLQISPSKTDRERVIPADPDLVAVLARIIRRIKRTGERVPLLTWYDGYELVFGPPVPHLFRCPSQHRLQVISANRIRELLTEHALRVGIVDGTPLRFTPHDFRRIFSTETVNGGLPIHIAAKVLGHLDLNTTQVYVAVYPEEVIRHYRQFVDQRRTHRPSEEYREPSDTEWQDSATTSACPRTRSAPATGPMAPLASMKTPVSGAPRSASTWPRSPDCWRSRPTPASASGRHSGCSGSAKSPAGEPAAHRRQETADRAPTGTSRAERERSWFPQQNNHIDQRGRDRDREPVTDSTWLNRDHQLIPGKELFRSERGFHLLAYTASHGQLLMRSLGRPDEPGEPETTIDLLFKPAAVMKIRDDYRGLAIRCATVAESEQAKADHASMSFGRDDRVFVLESQGESDYVVAMAVGWTEGVLGRTQQSFFHHFYPARPIIWPSQPLPGVDAGLNIASAQELIDALLADENATIRRERHRRVYVVMTRVIRPDGPDVTGAGVFLARADAEEAQAVITAKSVDCWIEELPIAI